MTTPQFLDRLILQAVPPNKWLIYEPFRYRTHLNREKGWVIKVPVGFENDLASIPRIFRRLIPQNGRHRWAAVIHDWLYHNKGVIGNVTVSRKEADQIFLEGMKASDVPLWKRTVMYLAVRMGGWLFWRE